MIPGMVNVEHSDRDEIKRLRRIIARLEKETGTRVITTEIVPREDKPGYLIYVTAPMVVSELEFGMAMYHAVVTGFTTISGEKMSPDFFDTTQLAPPEGKPQ